MKQKIAFGALLVVWALLLEVRFFQGASQIGWNAGRQVGFDSASKICLDTLRDALPRAK